MPSRRATRSPLFPFPFLLQNLLQVPLPSFLLFPQTAWATSTPSTNTTIDDTSPSTNTTIDDTSPSFTWPIRLGSVSRASTALRCSTPALPNTHNGTWHTMLSAVLLTCTAVYLFGVTSQNDTGTIEFTLDGVNGTTYTPPIIPVDDPSIGTPEGDHTYNTLFFWGGVVGGGFLLLSFALFLYIRRRRRKSQPRSGQIKPENRIEPLRIAPVSKFADESNSPVTASTLSASSTNLKARHFQSLPTTVEAAVMSAVTETSQAGSSPAPTTQNNVGHEADSASSSSPRPRTTSETPSGTNPSIRSPSSIGGPTTRSRSRQEIHEMEERIRWLESMILVQGRSPTTIIGVSQGAHAHPSTVLMSPFSEHGGGVTYGDGGFSEMEDLTNPPPPY
ncbi:hypothetical protein EV360DRAFT_84232 [Lentinula raphanica]|nr:hypothetical protein EV360DRAFT_84232 [Lentinula raphanica]